MDEQCWSPAIEKVQPPLHDSCRRYFACGPDLTGRKKPSHWGVLGRHPI